MRIVPRESVTKAVVGIDLLELALADSMKGQVSIESQTPMKPLEVAAFHVANKGTMVMLTLTPLNREGIAKSSDPEYAANNDKAVDDKELIVEPTAKSRSTPMSAVPMGGISIAPRWT